MEYKSLKKALDLIENDDVDAHYATFADAMKDCGAVNSPYEATNEVVEFLKDLDGVERSDESGWVYNFDPSALQVKADLGDRALDESDLNFNEGRSPGRSSLLRHLLPEFDIYSHSIGDYQGTMYFYLRNPNGERHWVIKESYGSCSHCDGLLNAAYGAGDIYSYGMKMCRNAYAFSSADDAKRFIRNVDGYGWKAREEIIEALGI